MLKLTLKGLIAHRLRLALTGLAVTLGVALMAGTMVFTDTIKRTFDDLFADVYENTDAVVRYEEAFETEWGDQRQKLDESMVDRVAAVDGVSGAQGSVFGYAQLVDANGDAVGNPAAGPPTAGFSWASVPQLNVMRLERGSRGPRAADEIVIDRGAANKGDFEVGDRVTVLTKAAPGEYTIVGIATFGTADSPGGMTMVMFTMPEAQRVLGEPGKVDTIEVLAYDQVSQAELVRRLEAAVSDVPRLEVLTGEEMTTESQDNVAKAMSFFDTFLLVFALVSLFVGAFIIFNTFSIIVAQRMKEMALLRAVGASRRQVTASILGESAVLGVLASIVGIVAGIGLAQGLKSLFSSLGMDLPAGGAVVTSRTITTSLLVGATMTIVSAIVPARRAGAVAPIAALRDVAVEHAGHTMRRTGAGVVVLGLGGVALFAGLFGGVSNAVSFVGLGALLVFLGVAVLGPVIAVPITQLVGWPLARLRGEVGSLARQNALRNPRRTSATASALMIGVALVSLITIVASSTKASLDETVGDEMKAEFVVTTGGMGYTGFSPTISQELAIQPEVETATGIRTSPAQVDGKTDMIFAVDPYAASSVWDFKESAGAVADLHGSGIAVHRDAAEDHGWKIGDRVVVTFPSVGDDVFTVQAIHRSEFIDDAVVSMAASERDFVQPLDMQVYVKLADGVSIEGARPALESVVDRYPNVKLQDQSQYADERAGAINQLLNLVYALLALAVIIALIGIANTLALSIVERTRELGLLRAVGMTRGQLRATVRWEAVIMAFLGTTLGIAVGSFFGWALVTALEDEGFNRLSIPIFQLVAIAMLAGAAGVVTAIRPSRRAAKLDVLQAITGE